MMSEVLSALQQRRLQNSDIHWDEFNSGLYYEHNYGSLRADDQQIMIMIRDFFLEMATDLPPMARGVDFGPGANLYPAMSMLPFCEQIDMLDYSHSNVRWLEAEIESPHQTWAQFWEVFRPGHSYAAVTNPWQELQRKASVGWANLLESAEARWDIGTMMFVADSISEFHAEFEAAVWCFLASLRQSAPFAMAFMAESNGYRVGEAWYPALPVNQRYVAEILSGVANEVRIAEIHIPADGPLRDGYAGMILALGRATPRGVVS